MHFEVYARYDAPASPACPARPVEEDTTKLLVVHGRRSRCRAGAAQHSHSSPSPGHRRRARRRLQRRRVSPARTSSSRATTRRRRAPCAARSVRASNMATAHFGQGDRAGGPGSRTSRSQACRRRSRTPSRSPNRRSRCCGARCCRRRAHIQRDLRRDVHEPGLSGLAAVRTRSAASVTYARRWTPSCTPRR